MHRFNITAHYDNGTVLTEKEHHLCDANYAWQYHIDMGAQEVTLTSSEGVVMLRYPRPKPTADRSGNSFYIL